MKYLVSSLSLAALAVCLSPLQAATLVHRYEFNGNVRDSVGELNGSPTPNIQNDSYKLEAPTFVSDAPQGASGPMKSIQLGVNAGMLKSGFDLAAALLDRASGSLSFWLKPGGAGNADSSPDYVIYEPKIGDGMFVAMNPGKHSDLAVRFGPEEGTTAASGVVAEGAWIHVVITWDESSGVNLYVDGALKGNAPFKGFPSTAGIRFGSFDFSGDQFLDTQYAGLIYDLQAYQGALSAKDAAYLYNHPGETLPGRSSAMAQPLNLSSAIASAVEPASGFPALD